MRIMRLRVDFTKIADKWFYYVLIIIVCKLAEESSRCTYHGAFMFVGIHYKVQSAVSYSDFRGFLYI